MKKKVLALLTACVMVAGMTACGGGSADTASKAEEKVEEAAEEQVETVESTVEEAVEEAADAAADGELIKVGIINNDPNESGYRTANDKDLN